MALASEGSGMDTTMLVGPAPYAMNSGNGNGFGGDGSWLILFLVILLCGGWGNGGFGGGNGTGGNGTFPWLLQATDGTNALISSGFQNAAISDQLSGIQSAVTNGFSSAEVAACNRAADTMQTAYSNQIASMNQRFSDVTALSSQLNGLNATLQNCCCQQAANTADLKYTVATEACADRAAVGDALNSVLSTMNSGIQSIKDQMCQDKIDAKNEQIANLQSQLNLANLSASQTAQTAQLLADNARQTSALEQYLNPAPIPAYVVQNPSCCNNGFYGCGCNG